MILGWWFRLTANKTVRLIRLVQNRDLAYLNERFEAGELNPVIDGPYKLSDAREVFRHYGAGNHKGKVVITIDCYSRNKHGEIGSLGYSAPGKALTGKAAARP